MGILVEFTCGNCGYKTQASGGSDRGEVIATQSMICRDCTEVVDVIVGVISDAPDYDKSINKERIGRCPRCNGANVFVWDESWPCPKCDEKMVQGSVVLWWD